MPEKAAILLSRQPLRPCNADAWVRQSHEAIHWLRENNLILNTSVGMQTWELLTALGSIHGVRQQIFISCSDTEQFLRERDCATHQFDLNPDMTEFVPVYYTNDSEAERAGQHERDAAVINASDILLPVSIRTNGQLNLLIERHASGGGKINTGFSTRYQHRTNPLAYRIPSENVNPQLDAAGEHYLIHWTRTFNAAWPTETQLEFYRAVVKSSTYPRTAFDSLRNILTSGVIKASTKHMPQGEALVSLSSRPPGEMAELMRWRSRYRQMSFEPYGIGIDRSLAARLSIEPVEYYNRTTPYECRKQDTSILWKTQSAGVKTDWQAECEHRHRGDLFLRDIPRDRIMLFCFTADEAAALEDRVGIRTVPFISE